ncbi:type II toxin-antitoxin system VapC family toxin [Agrobacterium tumefaciens]|uniref:hypothetical protein n=1 Tax=Agrobacterium tumefaciens TaxID=358 RepID=UPI001571BEA5|nr:hypothetical protein [Agrobacterium tumefaciens]NTE57482.1 type II toxin-antitoxin system VapC family toxin [Agrobacterium tumefaciens]NTE69976.1 type II toxin-antitoxin system VapC family toxin [Agrobacterium tumefaciens]
MSVTNSNPASAHSQPCASKRGVQKLGIDENDLWMCAQAKERDLVFVTADRRMGRIPEADPEVRLLMI